MKSSGSNDYSGEWNVEEEGLEYKEEGNDGKLDSKY